MLKFILKNKKVVFIAGDRRREVTHFIYFILRDGFSIFPSKGIPGISDLFRVLRSEIVIIEDNPDESPQEIKDFFYSLNDCVFVITETGKRVRIKELLRGFSDKWSLVLDFSMAKKIKRKRVKKLLTFGVNKKKADFYITDTYRKDRETNFKVNYEDNIIPFWIKDDLKNKDIYSILPALCLAELFDLNLAKVSYRIKEELTVFTHR